MFDWPFILDWWFGELDADGLPDEAHRKAWFAPSRRLDWEIRRRFMTPVLLASENSLDHWRKEPGGALAEIILLDQFTRNIHRRSPLAFAHDRLALKLANRALERGQDTRLAHIQRAFMYMPFQHAENLRAQEQGVELFDQLARSASGRLADVLRGFADFARQHRDIIHEFGRFPYRNDVLRRPSTAAETRWLEQGGPRFGQ